jgi:hypothetical protein
MSRAAEMIKPTEDVRVTAPVHDQAGSRKPRWEAGHVMSRLRPQFDLETVIVNGKMIMEK